jgi:prepilin-type processing-associated H-X9-DG protein
MYASDDRAGSLSGTPDDVSDDLSWLYPDYIGGAVARSIFVCPSTDNFIGTNMVTYLGRKVLADLQVQAQYKRSRNGRTRNQDLRGVSYEINAYMNWTTRKTEGSVRKWVHRSNAFRLKGQVYGPSDIYLIFDGDRMGPGAVNNYPDQNDNHGAAGVNMVMCDGSVKWVKGGNPICWPTKFHKTRTGQLLDRKISHRSRWFCSFCRVSFRRGEFDLYNAQVGPLLLQHCIKCHGPEKQRAGCDWTAGLTLRGGDDGVVIVPGKSSESLLIKLVSVSTPTK